MKKTIATILSALAAFILILCIIFGSVTLVINDDTFLENQLQQLNTAPAMGMNMADQARALHIMIEYMCGRLDSLDCEVMVHGQKVQMFALEIEQVHMVEVQELYLKLRSYFVYAALITLLLIIICIIIAKKQALVAICRGWLLGLALFTLIAAFVGTWAAGSFNAFWTFFHRIVFPGSENWLLPPESRMIGMLPLDFFSSVIARMCLYSLAALVVLLIAAITVIVVDHRRRNPATIIEEPEEDEPIEIEGPDLLAKHQIFNSPISRDSKGESGKEQE